MHASMPGGAEWLLILIAMFTGMLPLVLALYVSLL